MGSLIIALFAAGCSALSSFFFRKNSDKSSENFSPYGYLLFFYFISFILSFLLYPDIWHINVNFIVLSLGICVGILSSTLMVLTFQALNQGPAGLTFAFLNASAIFPGLILFLLLGTEFGFSCSLLQVAGMALVLLGLFLGVRNESTEGGPKPSFKWLKYALGCFIVQVLALTFIQGRCVFFHLENSTSFLSNFHVNESNDVWFMPGLFGASFITQAFLFLREKRSLHLRESIYGSLGGIGNFSSTCLLLWATKIALPLEKGLIFPCFAVSSMILCNVWAKVLYGEKFNFKTNALCSFGIFMAVAS